MVYKIKGGVGGPLIHFLSFDPHFLYSIFLTLWKKKAGAFEVNTLIFIDVIFFLAYTFDTYPIINKQSMMSVN